MNYQVNIYKDGSLCQALVVPMHQLPNLIGYCQQNKFTYRCQEVNLSTLNSNKTNFDIEVKGERL